jgi:hypothetical protein
MVDTQPDMKGTEMDESRIMPPIEDMRAAMREFAEANSVAPAPDGQPLPDDPDPEFGPDERL